MANINQRLNGLNTMAYMGVNPVQPPDFITKNRPPTSNDSKNVYLGQIWLDTGTNNPPNPNDIYMLVSLDGNVATWVSFGGGDLETLTGNSGGAVSPDGANNINIVGTGVISVVGNPVTNTLTITPSGSIASSFITSPATGTATPALGVLTFAGAGDVTVSASGSTVTITGSGSGTVTGLLTEDGNTVTPTAGVIQLLGGNNIFTTGTVGPNTATVSLSGITNHSLQVGGVSNSLTQLGVATNGQIPIGSTGADPVLSTITAGANITVTNGAGSITIASTGGSNPASTCNFKVTTTDLTPIPNLTGDGSATLVVWPQVMWDVGANYGGGTFTAPATGYYAFYHWIFFQGIDATNGVGGFVIYAKNGFAGERNNTADTNLFSASFNTGATPNYNSTTNMTIINMNIGDTMQCYVQWGNGAAAKTVGIAASNVAGGIINSHWGGYRIS